MDKIYYIVENDNPVGPYTAEELQSHGLNPQSRIYVMGWSEFRTACDIPELASFLSPAPSAVGVGNVIQEPKLQGGEEREMLTKIMSHLDELKRENIKLRQEMESMRENMSSVQTPPATPATTPTPPPPFFEQREVVTPPPFRVEPDTSTAAVPPTVPTEAEGQWTQEWAKNTTPASTPAPVVPKRKSSGTGCLVAVLIAIAVSVLVFIIINVSSKSHQTSYCDSDSSSSDYEYVYENVEEEAAPAAEAAPEEDYYYDMN